MNKNNKIERRCIDYEDAEIRVGGEKGRTIKGLGIVFNKWSRNLGGFRELISPDSVDERLLQNPKLISAFQHDPSKIMARVGSGTLKLTKTSRGVEYEYEAPNTTAGNDLLEMVKRGDVDGSSFVFRIAPENGSTWRKAEDGLMERTVTQMTWIGEIGAVVGQAYDDTTVAKRYLDELSSEEKEEARKAAEEQSKKENEPKLIPVNVIKHNQRRRQVVL